MLLKIKIFFFILFSILAASDYEYVYQGIRDICRPTKREWRLLQNYINYGERPYLEWLNTFDSGNPNDGYRYDLRAREFDFLGANGEKSDFELHTECINCGSEYRKSCVICYVSFNRGFPKRVKSMIDELKKSKFKGHFLYRIGGWPNVSAGSLKLIHVPYAFKVCLFKEAERLGYKRVLWMDTSFHPLRNFMPIFAQIEKDGYFVTSLNYSLRLRASRLVQEAFELTDNEMEETREIASGMIGVDFANPIGHEIIERWYKAAEELTPYLSPRPEQSAFAAIIYKMGLFPTGPFSEIVSYNKSDKLPTHYFSLGYK
jgi:hypothetical protein